MLHEVWWCSLKFESALQDFFVALCSLLFCRSESYSTYQAGKTSAITRLCQSTKIFLDFSLSFPTSMLNIATQQCLETFYGLFALQSCARVVGGSIAPWRLQRSNICLVVPKIPKKPIEIVPRGKRTIHAV